jgi:hypothetical protein
MQKLLDNLVKMIFGNPWTTLVAVLALGVFAVYSKTVTASQILNLVLTALLGLSAKDGHKGGDDGVPK